MRVKYFVNIVRGLIEQGLSQAEIAKGLGYSRQNMQNILGNTKDAKPQQNLKDEQISYLIRMCRKYRLEPNTWNKIGALIDSELKAEE